MKLAGKLVGEKGDQDSRLENDMFQKVTEVKELTAVVTTILYLLGAESISGDNLYSQVSGIYKAIGIEGNLSNHGIVRNHHGNRAKQHLLPSQPVR